MENKSKESNTILDEAKKLIYGDREKAYGDPSVNLRRISRLWGAYLERPIEVKDVAMMMILLKVVREKHSHKRDNIVDIAGYAALIDRAEGGDENE